PTRRHLGVRDRIFFAVLVKNQMADTEVQEQIVRSSGLDWTLIQPVHLHDTTPHAAPFLSSAGETGAMKVSRVAVGQAIGHVVDDPTLSYETVSVSG
ncbi:MAG: NAD(P)H-binding protein, partial [Actinomycetota bacterium]